MPPTSSLLRNDNGKFTNVTPQWSEGLMNVGMVTDARFADLDRDGSQELIVTGEWMPISVFRKVDNKFVNVTSALGLSDLSGWWYTLEITDINNDSFPDIVAGNLGLNAYIQASPGKPAELFYKDFDKNGTIDPILCYYNGEDSYPPQYRDRMLDQMIYLKRNLPDTIHTQMPGLKIFLLLSNSRMQTYLQQTPLLIPFSSMRREKDSQPALFLSIPRYQQFAPLKPWM
ncbi:MAG: VCBS repeat-containing protein [Saprospiraceae bacterium]|nr:VCBS repeat-containing protein [Candidatus Opimibacter skivensis]